MVSYIFFCPLRISSDDYQLFVSAMRAMSECYRESYTQTGNKEGQQVFKQREKGSWLTLKKELGESFIFNFDENQCVTPRRELQLHGGFTVLFAYIGNEGQIVTVHLVKSVVGTPVEWQKDSSFSRSLAPR